MAEETYLCHAVYGVKERDSKSGLCEGNLRNCLAMVTGTGTRGSPRGRKYDAPKAGGWLRSSGEPGNAVEAKGAVIRVETNYGSTARQDETYFGFGGRRQNSMGHEPESREAYVGSAVKVRLGKVMAIPVV